MPRANKRRIAPDVEAKIREVDLQGRFAPHLRAIALGDKPYPNAAGDRHHYVPEFLLRRFRAPGSRYLFQLDKTDGRCTQTTPKEAGWETRLYTVESVTGEHDGLIEALFGLAENYAAESLAVLLRDPGNLSEDDRADLAYFIAIQEQRAPGFLAEHTQRIEQMATMQTAVELANRKGSAKKRQQARDAYHQIVEGAVELGAPREFVLTTVLETLAQIAGLVVELPWLLIQAAPGSFVCSDRPLSRHDPAPPHEWSGAGWLSSPLVQTMLPLSSAACLRIRPADKDRLAVKEWKSPPQIERINLRTYGWATRYVYGASQRLLEDLHARAVAHPEEVPHPSPQRAVILEDLAGADPEVAARNRERGWPGHVVMRNPQDGSFQAMSYEVIDSMDDARRAVSPRRKSPADPSGTETSPEGSDDDGG